MEPWLTVVGIFSLVALIAVGSTSQMPAWLALLLVLGIVVLPAVGAAIAAVATQRYREGAGLPPLFGGAIQWLTGRDSARRVTKVPQ